MRAKTALHHKKDGHMQFVPKYYKQGQLPQPINLSAIEEFVGTIIVSCCYEKLVAVARYRSEIQRKGNVRR
jgi:hypothetical protein